MNTQQILAALKDERARIDEAIAALERVDGKKTKTGRHMSAEARARISKAMKVRWAARKKKLHVVKAG